MKEFLINEVNRLRGFVAQMDEAKYPSQST